MTILRDRCCGACRWLLTPCLIGELVVFLLRMTAVAVPERNVFLSRKSGERESSTRKGALLAHFNPGHAFRDGKFYVFTLDGAIIMRAWGLRAGAWRYFGGEDTKGWTGYSPYLYLDSLGKDVRRLERERNLSRYGAHRLAAARRFLDTIPSDAMRLVAPTDGGQWRQLQLLNRIGEPAFELSMTNPALFWVVAERRRFTRRYPRMRGARSLLRLRRREIADAIGFGGIGSVRILEKVPRALVGPRLWFLRQALADPVARKFLLHLDRITTGVIRVASDSLLLDRVTFSFLEELSRAKSAQGGLQIVWRLVDLIGLQERIGARRSTWRHVADVDAEHARIVERLGRNFRRRAFVDEPFPDPPVRAVEGITPIRSSGELLAEGERMRHCVGAYGRDAVESRLAFYHVSLAGEEATLSIARSGGVWSIRELRAWANGPVTKELHDHVKRWLVLSYLHDDSVTAADLWGDEDADDDEIIWPDEIELERVGETERARARVW